MRNPEPKPEKREDVVEADDPIEMAMGARKAAGTADTVIKEPEARRKKMRIPRALNLRPGNAKEVTLTLISPEQ